VIKDLDATLQQMLAGEAAAGSELASATISFAAPEKDWRASATGLNLAVYLYRVVENRELRSNERRLSRGADGLVTIGQFPARIDCTYLITAWNMGAMLPGVERERQEHRLLSQVLFVLLRNPEIPRGYLFGLLAGTQEIDPPSIAAQMDDMANIPDFWSGFETHVRPAIACKVTLSLDLARDLTTPMVGSALVSAGGDELFVAGGMVTTGAPPVAVPGAWVRVAETGRVYVTDTNGRFTIDRIGRGAYTVHVRAIGFKEAITNISVPTTDGVYAVTLVP